MRKTLSTIITSITLTIILLWALPALAVEETSHLAFVSEYLRELAAIEQLREDSTKEIKDDKSQSEVIGSSIHWSTLVQLELQSDISTLKDMRLDPPFESVIPAIIEIYKLKIQLHQDMIDKGSAFLAGPKPGVDYGQMAADMPKIRAFLDQTDHTLFSNSPLVFATLIDQKPNSQNHLSHLVITKAQRESLLHDLKVDFGKKLDQKDQNYTVSSAWVLKSFLENKDRQSSDEPWK